MATSDQGASDDAANEGGNPTNDLAKIVNEAKALQAEIDAYQQLKDAADKAGDSGSADYYDTQMQTIQNEIAEGPLQNAGRKCKTNPRQLQLMLILCTV